MAEGETFIKFITFQYWLDKEAVLTGYRPTVIALWIMAASVVAQLGMFIYYL